MGSPRETFPYATRPWGAGVLALGWSIFDPARGKGPYGLIYPATASGICSSKKARMALFMSLEGSISHYSWIPSHAAMSRRLNK